ISWIAYMILVISCMTIFISLYKMVKEHAFDLALLRTYGASNVQLIRMVGYEGCIIGLLAFLLGLILSNVGLYFMFKMIETEYKQNMLHELAVQEFLPIGAMVFIMILASIALAI